MRILARWLDARGVLWLHPPNEGKRSIIAAALMKRDGLIHTGAPDVFIFEPWICGMGMGHGLAVELKRIKGGRTTAEQKQWLDALTQRGWATKVAKGADEAITWLQERLPRF